MIHHKNKLIILLVMNLATLIRSQRPLNTTTNTSGVLTEPFFVKPTSISTSKQHYPEQRGGGGSYYNNFNEMTGFRNKDRLLTHPYLNADQINQTGIMGEHGNSQPVPATNRLHKVNKVRQNKFTFNQFLQIAKNPNFTLNQNHRGEMQVHGELQQFKKDARPEKFVGGPADNNNDDQKSKQSNPSSAGKMLAEVQKQLQHKNHMHTPSPPSYAADDIDFDEKLGVKCSFEKQCAWTYDLNVNGTNFEVTTGQNLTLANITGVTPGPSADNLNNGNGHFLHLPLTNDTSTRILRSPIFSSTLEKCYLEVFLHQSSMNHGTIKIVIERIKPAGSWVPAEIIGDDFRKWKYHTFEIDKYVFIYFVTFDVKLISKKILTLLEFHLIFEFCLKSYQINWAAHCVDMSALII